MARTLVTRRRRTAAAAALAAALLLTACGGSGEEEAAAPTEEPTPAEVPLPEEPPAPAGAADGTPLEPVWLEESTGTDESQDYDDYDARSGTVVVGDVVIGYNRDIVTGTRLEDGEQLWQADLDMAGGQTCLVSRPDTEVEVVTVTYGEYDCTAYARVSVADGQVLETYTIEDDYDRGVVDLATYDGVDHLTLGDGSVLTVEGDQEPAEALPPARKGLYRVTGAHVDDPDVLLHTVDASINGRLGDLEVVAYSVPELEELWRRPMKQLAPRGASGEGGRNTLLPRDGRLLVGQLGGVQQGFTPYVSTLDPMTGEVVATASGEDTAMGTPGPDGVQYDVYDLDVRPQDPSTFMRLGESDRLVKNAGRGLSRISAAGEVAWTFSASDMELRQGIDDAFVQPAAVTADGSLALATLSNGQSVDVLVLDTASGELVARYPVPDEYSLGLATEPEFTLVAGRGVLLARNLRQETMRQGEVPDLEGTPYDVGFFAFPQEP